MQARSPITQVIIALLALTVIPVAAPSITAKAQASTEAAGPNAIIGANDLKNIQNFAPGGLTPNAIIYGDRRPVGAIALATKMPYIDLSFCSGFLIGPDRFLTNAHCGSNSVTFTQADCNADVVWFNYELAGGVNQPVDIRNCTSVASESDVLPPADADLSHLDYALLVLAGQPGNTWGWLTVSNRDPVNSEGLTVIQHPNGQPKMADSYFSTSDSCLVSQAFSGSAELDHTCDTDSGSSGSPVIAKNGNVVIGLHHAGIPGGPNFAVRINTILFTAGIGPTSTVVGGTIQPANMIALFAPFIALALALLSTITAVTATHLRRIKH